MSERLTLTVPGMHCGHCEAAVKEEISAVPGVASVAVDLDSKLVSVIGEELDAIGHRHPHIALVHDIDASRGGKPQRLGDQADRGSTHS